MPSESISQALKESYAQANVADVYLETLAIKSRSPGQPGSGATTLDLAYVIDDTSSMGSFINTVKANIEATVNSLEGEFNTVRYALITFKDEGAGQTEVITDFITDSVAFIAFIDALSVGGGGDTPENGFGATVLGGSLNWGPTTSANAKVMWLITDQPSHERGATEVEALQSLLDEGVSFVLGSEGGDSFNYGDLVTQTGGDQIDFDQTDEEVLDDFLDVVKDIAVADEELFRIVNAPVAHDLALTAGGELVTFEPAGFRLTVPGQNDQGVASMNIALDNIDKRLGDLVQGFAESGQQMVLEYRIYLLSDPTTPQNDPPLEMVMSGVKTNLFTVSGSATFADIVNMKFLTQRYTTARFHGLSN